MSAPMDNVSEPNSETLERFCEIEATVATGLEEIAKDEAAEKLGVVSRISRGRILFQIPVKNVPKALELCCIDNLFVLMTERKDFPFVDDELECMKLLRAFVKEVDWPHGLAAWNQIFSFHVPISTRPEQVPEILGEPTLSSRYHQKKNTDAEGQTQTEGCSSKKKKFKRQGKWKKLKKDEREEMQKNMTQKHGDKDIDFKESQHRDKGEDASKLTNPNEEGDCESADLSTELVEDPALKKQRTKQTTHNPLLPSFRVTCNRNGKNHCFDSMGAASNFGGAVNEYFGWNVSMKNFDIEVVLSIEETDLRVCLALTKESMHKRNIISFGPTTLRPTIAYCLLRLCNIKDGDIVCDPMCGTGSIPIQASLGWPGSYHLCGEIYNKALMKTSDNVQHVNHLRTETNKRQIQLDPLLWNVHYLPLRTGSVDVFVTDLPFGVRMGSKQDNRKLYPGAMMDMARVCRVGSGRAAILTQDKRCFSKALGITAKYWKCWKMTGFNMGGLAGCIYSLYRTSEAFDTKDSKAWMSEVHATARNKDS